MQWQTHQPEHRVAVGTILVLVLVVAPLSVIPAWPHSRRWGYAPSHGVGLLLIVLAVLILLGRV